MKARTRADIVVVGGGIAGLYAAFKLMKAGHDVVLLESSDRLGGRIQSVRIPGTQMVAELGAMRFDPKVHVRLKALIAELDLTNEERQFDFPSTREYFLRGQRFSGEAFMTQEIYKVKELGIDGAAVDFPKTPDRLVNYAIAKTLLDIEIDFDPSIDAARLLAVLKKQALMIMEDLSAGSRDFKPRWELSDHDWELVKRLGLLNLEVGDGRERIRLSKTGFWNLLEYYLGGEGFQLIHDALGYESLVSNWNSAEAIPWFIADFTNEHYSTLSGGMGLLVERLEESLIGRIRLKARVTEIQKLDPDGSHWLVRFDSNEGTRAIHTEHVILALPRRPLDRLVINYGGAEDPRWTQIRHDELTHVRRNTLFKVFLIFEDEWWRALEGNAPMAERATGDRRITDLPIRQIYYYGKEWIAAHCLASGQDDPELRRWVMIMASYSDSHYVSFWRPFIRQRGEDHEGVLNLRDGDISLRPRLSPIARQWGVPPRMVEKIRRQLAEIHGVDVTKIPEPILGLYVNWGFEPDIKAGWHSWQVGVQANKTVSTLRAPFGPGSTLHICGEAYSFNQGWIEGALQSADAVLGLFDQPTVEETERQ